MVYVCEYYLKELVSQDGAAISKAKEGVVCEDSGQAHGASMQDTLMTQSAEGSMAMHYSDGLTDQDLSENR